MKFDISNAIPVLSATPSALRALLSNLPDNWTGSDANDLAEPRSDWEVFDVVGHLIHAEDTDWIPRARIILDQGEDTTFEPFDRFAMFEKSKGKSMLQLLDEFARKRSESLDTLRSWNLTGDRLALEGRHPELGTVTLGQLLATWVVHDLTHIRQIVTIMAKRYETEVGVWRDYLSILE